MGIRSTLFCSKRGSVGICGDLWGSEVHSSALRGDLWGSVGIRSTLFCSKRGSVGIRSTLFCSKRASVGIRSTLFCSKRGPYVDCQVLLLLQGQLLRAAGRQGWLLAPLASGPCFSQWLLTPWMAPHPGMTGCTTSRGGAGQPKSGASPMT